MLRKNSGTIITEHGRRRLFERLGCATRKESEALIECAFKSQDPIPDDVMRGTVAFAVTRKSESPHEWLAYRYYRKYMFIFSEYFNPETLTRHLKLITVYDPTTSTRPDKPRGSHKSRAAGRSFRRSRTSGRRVQSELDSSELS